VSVTGGATAALGLNVGTAMLPASVRAPAPTMDLFGKFVYAQQPGPLSQNFAANMGECAQIDVAKGYKARLTPTVAKSAYSSFLYDAPTPLGRHTPPPRTSWDAPQLVAVKGVVVPTAEPEPVEAVVEAEVEEAEVEEEAAVA